MTATADAETTPVTAKTRPGGTSTVDLLRRAKTYSDARQWDAKANILLGLMRDRPRDWYVDSDEGGHVVGVTHRPTKWRFHMPRAAVAPHLLAGGRPESWYDVPYKAAAEAATLHAAGMTKRAASVTLPDLANFALSFPGVMPDGVNELWGGPRPAINLLAGGAVGAGMGWLGGRAAEQLLPARYFTPGKLRRTAAILGAIAGASPAAYMAMDNLRSGHGPLAVWPQPDPGAPLNADGYEQLPHWPQPRPGTLPEGVTKGIVTYDGKPVYTHGLVLDPAGLRAATGETIVKGSAFNPLATDPYTGTLSTGALFDRIPKDGFGNVIWTDPSTPLPVKAITMGLVEAASATQGGGDPTAFSIGQVAGTIASAAVGAGVGHVIGHAVGKTLGALAGLTPEGQDALKRTGMWAGILTSVIPRVLGR